MNEKMKRKEKKKREKNGEKKKWSVLDIGLVKP